MRLKFDWFIYGMAIAVIMAWAFPEPGAKGGALHPEIINNAGVALVFFLHGLLLSPSALKNGALRWRLHVLIQSATFIVFPLIGLAAYYMLDGIVVPALALGFFYLCALPSTVSSSVAMTAAAKGNVPVAVFNAAISSLIGIFITPLLLQLVIHQSGQGMPLGKVIIDLLTLLVLPLLAGQVMRPIFGNWAMRNKSYVNKVDRLTILLIIYTSFCDSMKSGIWEKQDSMLLLMVGLGCVVLFFTMFALMYLLCRMGRLSLPDMAAVIFCGSKKSLVAGVPMAQLIFGASPELSLILLPIMIYHPFQLIIAAPVSARFAREIN